MSLVVSHMLNATENPCIYNDNDYHGFVVKHAFSGSIRVFLQAIAHQLQTIRQKCAASRIKLAEAGKPSFDCFPVQ